MKRIIIYASAIIINSFWLTINGITQSIDTLVDRALENNLELKVLEKEYYAALEKAPQVSELPDPEVGVGIFPSPVETRLGPQILRVGATQMFPWKGLLNGKKDLELAKAKALFERIESRALDLSYQVKLAYFQLYEIEKSQSILRRSLPLLEALEQLALSKVESGKTNAADVLRVQLKIDELNQELAILEIAKAKPKATINQLLNRSLDNPIIVTDTFSFAIVPYDIDYLADNIEENHPTIRMFALQQDISRQAIALNELNGKPVFGVGLDYIMVNQRNDVELAKNGRDIVQLRGTVKIPLFRNKYEAKEQEEKIKIEALAYRKEDVLNRFLEAIEKSYTDHETARLRMNLYQKQIEITQSAIRILESDYSANGNRFDELLQLEKDLIDYDLKLLKAIVQSHMAKSSIERFLIL